MANATQIIELNVSLRLFMKPGTDLAVVSQMVHDHFGKGDAIAGSGYEEALAASLKDAVIRDIAASDEGVANNVREAIDSVDLWRDERSRGDQSSSYEIHEVP